MTSHSGGGERCLAVITGATGITGRSVVSYILASKPSWRIVTLSRRHLELGLGSKGVDQADRVLQAHADLLVAPEVRSALENAAGDVKETRCVIFHCAYVESGEGASRDCELNLAMLKNAVEAVETAGWPLKHVFTMEGSKWYGHQFLVPLETPFIEKHGADRHAGRNFYYDLEDYLRGRVEDGAAWTWSALRPNPVMGFSTGSYESAAHAGRVWQFVCGGGVAAALSRHACCV